MPEGGVRGTTYADAGVDRAEGARAEEGILRLAERTLTADVVRTATARPSAPVSISATPSESSPMARSMSSRWATCTWRGCAC